jgi:hypothetical protein
VPDGQHPPECPHVTDALAAVADELAPGDDARVAATSLRNRFRPAGGCP